MEEKIYISNLFDIYDSLFTKIQKEYFKLYYFENLTLEEIAENYNISRSAVFKSINHTVNKLKEYEEIFKLNEKSEIIKKLLESNDIVYIKKELEKII